jgi:Secretion system C-terminal sorting domain
MKNLITLVIVIVSLAGNLYAQNGSHKLSGQIFFDKLDRTTDGGFICLTSDTTTATLSRWTGSMTNKWAIQFPKSMKTLSTNGYYYAEGYSDVIPRANGNFLMSLPLVRALPYRYYTTDSLLMCTLDPTGNVLWQKYFTSQAKGICKVQKDIGTQNSYLMAMQNNILVKCNQYGAIEWQRAITSSISNKTFAVASIVSFGSDYLVALADTVWYVNPPQIDSSNSVLLIIDQNGNLKKSAAFNKQYCNANNLDVCVASNKKDIYVKNNYDDWRIDPSSNHTTSGLLAVLDSNLQIVSASRLGYYWDPTIYNPNEHSYSIDKFEPAGDGDNVFLLGNLMAKRPYLQTATYTESNMALNKLDRLGTILERHAGQPYSGGSGVSSHIAPVQHFAGLYQNQGLMYFGARDDILHMTGTAGNFPSVNTCDLNDVDSRMACGGLAFAYLSNLGTFSLTAVSATFTLSPTTAISTSSANINFTPSTISLSTSCGSMTTNLANEITQDEVSVWVNQNNMVETNLPAESITKISVFNLQGQLITKSSNTQSISGLSSGLYLCEINLKNRKSFTAKLLVP